jgi:hypothetical protein
MARVAGLSLATTCLGGVAFAQTAPGSLPVTAAPPPSATQSLQPAKPAGQGIAVLAVGDARQDAFDLARALYGSRLRPVNLDEVRARVLAGDPPPANASRELRELAELRAGVTGEDAAGRRLLTGLAQQVGAQALVVVKIERAAAPAPAPSSPPAGDGDAGAAAPTGDAGASASSSPAPSSPAPGNAAAGTAVVARVFLAETGEFDAARYQPEPGLKGAAAWRATVASLEARFPAASRTVAPTAATASTPVKLRPEEEKSSPFYASGWFWGALGGAALLGAAFYFASQDTSSDPIHLQMRVPR